MNLTAGEHEPCNGTSLGQMAINLSLVVVGDGRWSLRRLIDTVHGVANCAQLR